MRIIVFGSRSWADRRAVFGAIRDAIAKHEDPGWPHTIVHGNCPTGADYYAELAAVEFAYEVERFTPDWRKYGRKAGPMRNAEMCLAGADVALGFRKPGKSNGTDSMRRLLAKAGISTELYGEGWK